MVSVPAGSPATAGTRSRSSILMCACPSTVAISDSTPGRLGTSTTTRVLSPLAESSTAIRRSRPSAALAKKVCSHSRSSPRRASSTSSNSVRWFRTSASTASRLARRMSVQSAGLAPATRVRSRNDGPAERSASRPCGAVPAAWRMSADAMTCGRCDTKAIRWSCTSASTATGIAPTDDTMPCTRCSRSGRVSSVGVRNHVAPSKRSSRACSTPVRSPPATGWPPQKRARSSGVSAASTLLFADPTSVTTASASATASTRRTTSVMSPTGAHTTMIDAPVTASTRSSPPAEMAPHSVARAMTPSPGSTPRTSVTPARPISASPRDPPMRPTPTRATGPGSPVVAIRPRRGRARRPPSPGP